MSTYCKKMQCACTCRPRRDMNHLSKLGRNLKYLAEINDSFVLERTESRLFQCLNEQWRTNTQPPFESFESCWKTIAIFPWPWFITDRNLNKIGSGILKLSNRQKPVEKEKKTLTKTRNVLMNINCSELVNKIGFGHLERKLDRNSN